MNFQFTHPYYLLLLAPALAWVFWFAWKSDVADQQLAAMDSARGPHARADLARVCDCRLAVGFGRWRA